MRGRLQQLYDDLVHASIFDHMHVKGALKYLQNKIV